jgi:Vacuolar (H+)-ATPase G subunit
MILIPKNFYVDRTQKLKDARSEAAKEIEELKSKQEDEFNSFKKEVRVYHHDEFA